MKKLSITLAELKSADAYKKSVYSLIHSRPNFVINLPANRFLGVSSYDLRTTSGHVFFNSLKHLELRMLLSQKLSHNHVPRAVFRFFCNREQAILRRETKNRPGIEVEFHTALDIWLVLRKFMHKRTETQELSTSSMSRTVRVELKVLRDILLIESQKSFLLMISRFLVMRMKFLQKSES